MKAIVIEPPKPTVTVQLELTKEQAETLHFISLRDWYVPEAMKTYARESGEPDRSAEVLNFLRTLNNTLIKAGINGSTRRAN